MTNGDKIRSMSDEELFDWLDSQYNEDREDWEPIGCYRCTNYGTHHTDKSYIGTESAYLYECSGCEFENGILEWLRKEI